MLLITGATGNVGGYVCDLLSLQNQPFLKASSRKRDDPQTRWLDFLKPESFHHALKGITTVFLVRPPALANPGRDMLPFLMTCRDQGIQKIVFLSLQGADTIAVTPHAKIEKCIVELGIPFVFLRPSFFMQNLTMQQCADIRDNDEILVPAGRGRTNFIDARDIAESAVRCLTDSALRNRALTLTGSNSYTYDAVAELLTQALGRPIHYRKPGLLPYIIRTRKKGHPLDYAVITGLIFTMARLGKASGSSQEMVHLLGRSPRTLEEFIKEHALLWNPNT